MVSVFLKNDNIKVKAGVGKTMRQIATASGASMEFGCRVGDCATCIAKIEFGMQLLNQKTEKEIKVLKMLGGDVSGLRLMCQSHIRCEEGEIVVSYIF